MLRQKVKWTLTSRQPAPEGSRQNSRKLDWAQDRKESTLLPTCQYRQPIHACSQLSPHQTSTVSKHTACLPEQQVWEGPWWEAAERWRTATGRIEKSDGLGFHLGSSPSWCSWRKEAAHWQLPVTHHPKARESISTTVKDYQRRLAPLADYAV